jgi:hypothetical protein
MNPLGPETALLVLTDVLRLLAVIAVAFAAASVIGVLALTLAEWKQAVREDNARRQRMAGQSVMRTAWTPTRSTSCRSVWTP